MNDVTSFWSHSTTIGAKNHKVEKQDKGIDSSLKQSLKGIDSSLKQLTKDFSWSDQILNPKIQKAYQYHIQVSKEQIHKKPIQDVHPWVDIYPKSLKIYFEDSQA